MKTPRPKLRDRTSVDSVRADVREGSPLPLGTQKSGKGVNFALFTRHAAEIQLELFDHPEDAAILLVRRAPRTEGR